MLDLTYLPRPSISDIQIFQTAGAWGTWCKPRSTQMVMVWMIGGAGGGGGGFSAASGNPRGGGGPGGCAATVRLQFPAIILPDVLFVQCGAGGLGGAAGIAGSSGNKSFITRSQDNTANANLIAISENLVTSGGNAGTAGGGGGAGSGGTIPTSATAIGFNFGLFLAIAGTSGSNGGAQTGAAGGNSTPMNSCALSPGAGGAGTTSADFAGGNITGNGPILTQNGGAAGSNRGSDGLKQLNPFIVTGGTGGGASNTGVGGGGGHGGWGCGGGGGGGGTTGGTGGNGGDGLVIIVSW